MNRIALPILLALAVITPTASAGSPSTTRDADASIRLYYSQKVRESAYVNTRVTYTCNTTNLRGVTQPNQFICRTRLYAGSPRRLRVVTHWLIYCQDTGWCSIEKRLITWRHQ